ncbi:Tyrosinase [Dactylella cylindrospora]|nr:Tyrosinase [Dactylella cylindrospora]
MKFFQQAVKASFVGLAVSSVVSAAVLPRCPAPEEVAAPTVEEDAAVASPDSLSVSGTSPLLPWPTPSKSYCNPRCTPIVRKSWRKLSNTEKAKYIAAVQCLTKKKSISGIPGAQNIFDDFQGTHSEQTPAIHWVGHFVLWHRYFLATYEIYLRKLCGYTGAQPYWDWEYDNASRLDMAKWSIFNPTTGFGGNGPYQDGDNPFGIPDRSGGGCVPDGPFAYPKFTVNMGPGESTGYNPHCLTRDFSRPIMKWGNQSNINWVWDTPDYGHFTRRLENLPDFTIPNIHGSGHFGVGGALGTIGDAYNSPGDPLFYLHHANLDRVFWQWQWQKKNLPKSLTQVSGPIVPFDYDNLSGGNVTASFKINIGTLAPDAPLSALLNTQDILCYTYEKP